MLLTTNINPHRTECLSNPRRVRSLAGRVHSLTTHQEPIRRLKLDQVSFDVTLLNRKGERVNLQNRIDGQPIVLLIHHGQACTDRDEALQVWEKALPIFARLGITVIEIVPQIQDSLFSSIPDSTLLEVLIDVGHQMIPSFTSAPYLLPHESKPHTTSAFPDGLSERPVQLACAIAADQIFVVRSASSNSINPVDPMRCVKVLDPDYWLALV